MTLLYHKIFSTLLQIAFPARCVGCRRESSYCCEKCLAEFPAPPGRSPGGAFALFDYRDRRVKQLIWLLKYRGGREVAKTFAAALYDRILDEAAEVEMFYPGDEPWLVVPIPLSRARRFRRGYNQAEEIARGFLRLNSRNFEAGFEVLARPEDRPSQLTLRGRAARFLNADHAFRVAEAGRVRGRRIILVDDVTTTGATLAAARVALLEAGARLVLPAAVAQG